MEVVHARCAGLDVHKQTVVACVRVTLAGRAHHDVRTFATTAADLRELHEWLVAAGCTHAVLVWHRLEEHLTLVLANATAVRNLPGRKSDVSDAQWLADLLAHGLVRGSFVPPAPIQALRELTRTRKQLGREVTAHSQRIEKVLESADVKLATVLHPLLGVSGRAILAALAAGETDPDRLVALAHPALRAKRAALRAALPGHVRPHHGVPLQQHLRVVATLQVTIAELDAAITAALAALSPVGRATGPDRVLGAEELARTLS